MRSFLLSRRFLKDRRLPEGKGGPFGAPSALSVYIVLLKKGMSQWFGMGAIGHTFGVRVDGASPRRFLRFLSLTTFQAEGYGIALTGDEFKVSVTGLAFSVIWHDRHSADWLAALASPYPASPDFSTGKRVTRFSGRFASLRIVFPCHPCSGGRIKHRETFSS